jgi:hypothetical protein
MHHLHLRSKGSQALIFAKFEREAAYFILLGDHRSFDDGSLEEAVINFRAQTNTLVLNNVLGLERNYTPQIRNRLAKAGISTFASVAGKIVLSGMVSTAGTSDVQMHVAQQTLRRLQEIDPRLDEADFLKKIVPTALGEIIDPRWIFYYSDLCIADSKTGTTVCVTKGPL